MTDLVTGMLWFFANLFLLVAFVLMVVVFGDVLKALLVTITLSGLALVGIHFFVQANFTE